MFEKTGMKLFVIAVFALTLVWNSVAAADDPEEFLRGRLAHLNRVTNRFDGEEFAWHAAHGVRAFLQNYENTEDPAWLEVAAQYYDMYIDELKEDPDGYRGWIGDYLGYTDADWVLDAIVGDAILIEHPLRWAEIVLADPELEERFGEKAREYVELAEEIIWEKWNARNTYYLDKGYGSYHRPDDNVIGRETWEWVDAPWRKGISENLNKHYAAGTVILRLYRITGEEKYAQRVFEIYSRLKNMFRYFPEDDRISWNFWMPHRPSDIEGRSPRSWVAVHPTHAGYQAGEVARIVEVYDTGLVFDEEDIQRLINTNRYMDLGDGEWQSSDGTTDAGTRWGALARFEEGDWERRFVDDEDDIRIYDRDPEPGRYISMNQVIPGTIEYAAGQRTILATQVRGAGNLTISLIDRETGDDLGVIHEEEIASDGSRYVMPRWDGTNPASGEKEEGEYYVEWRLRDEARRQRVTVIEGEPVEEDEITTLRPGETLRIDFSDEPDPELWHLGGAERSREHVRSGDYSLRLGSGQEARLIFGGEEDLPVRISMWIHEEGVQRPDATSGEGPRWGVITGIGDILAIRVAWRGYLDGDQGYSWTDTGENAWFNLNWARMPRRSGWSEWVFDFSDPDDPSVVSRGQRAAISDERMPDGAVGIYLHGSSAGGPLHVDDIVVEYPEQ